MLKNWRKKLEDLAVAAAFAMAGDHESAVRIIRPRRQKRPDARTRARATRRAEIRAQAEPF